MGGIIIYNNQAKIKLPEPYSRNFIITESPGRIAQYMYGKLAPALVPYHKAYMHVVIFIFDERCIEMPVYGF